jgi:hypothetical protein
VNRNATSYNIPSKSKIMRAFAMGPIEIRVTYPKTNETNKKQISGRFWGGLTSNSLFSQFSMDHLASDAYGGPKRGHAF